GSPRRHGDTEIFSKDFRSPRLRVSAVTSEPVALLGAGLAAGALLATLAAVHLPLTVALPDLVAAGALAYALLVVTEPLARRIAPAAPGGARVAAGLVAGAFLVRFGLMALP